VLRGIGPKIEMVKFSHYKKSLNKIAARRGKSTFGSPYIYRAMMNTTKHLPDNDGGAASGSLASSAPPIRPHSTKFDLIRPNSTSFD
jgi:hypothetical protein